MATYYVITLMMLLTVKEVSSLDEIHEVLFKKLPGCSKDHAHPVTPLKSTHSPSPIKCMVDCTGDDTCFAVNVCKTAFGGVLCHHLPQPSDGTCGSLQITPTCDFFERKTICENGVFNFTALKCDCQEEFTGSHCQRRYRDCTEAYEGGMRSTSTVYSHRWILIQPQNSPQPFQVNCYFQSGGWLVFDKFELYCPDTYNRTWLQYRDGWLTPCSIWLGLEKLHQITRQGGYTMDVNLRGNGGMGGSFYYKDVLIASEDESYSLTYTSGFPHSGTPIGDGTIYGGLDIRGRPFAAKDRPDPANCAVVQGAGWWYGTQCPDVNLHMHIDVTSSATNVAKWPDEGNTVLQAVSDYKIQLKGPAT